jgi:hypothetical protein
MQLEIKVDRNSVNERLQSGKEILLEIAWENNGSYYPMNPWLDFGVVILGWWSTAISSVAKGEQDSAKLSFMDGPYALMMKIDRITQEVTLSSENGKFEAKSSINEIKRQLILAIEKIDQDLLDLDVVGVDRNYLAECIKLLC